MRNSITRARRSSSAFGDSCLLVEAVGLLPAKCPSLPAKCPCACGGKRKERATNASLVLVPHSPRPFVLFLFLCFLSLLVFGAEENMPHLSHISLCLLPQPPSVLSSLTLLPLTATLNLEEYEHGVHSIQLVSSDSETLQISWN